jgi:O-antigen biosynthesis protein
MPKQPILLSVIIVNYNVEHFLEQCLHSVYKSVINVPSEIFVVDNNSVDGSVEMVKQKFPGVKIIQNHKNTGFSYANNQAIRQSKGKYVLLLNPDTVVEEDTFEKTVAFMETHPEAGGLGVKMLDGKGNFLPESKRGLPTPSVAFFKMFGFSKLFPKSKIFGRYHLGYLDKDKVHQVDVLSGAFMLLRKETLEKTGLLDEDFFMYGEDIDLSYRITKVGYKNYYYPETRIIHYKGESTKKSSINYVFVFYRAMVIFAKKHFSEKNASTFSFLINLAIYIRAGASLLIRFIKKSILQVLDAGMILAGLWLIKSYYEHNIKFTEGGQYSSQLISIAFPAYALIWLVCVFLSGGYDKPVKLVRIFRGVIIGTAVILIVYALLPEIYRFSRALILLGTAWTMIVLIFSRVLLHLLKIKGFALDSDYKKRVVIAGEKEECERVNSLLKQTSANTAFTGFIYPQEPLTKPENYIGTISQLNDAIEIYKIDEVIFCAKNISAQKIISQMAQSATRSVDYKIAPPESLSIIGSNSIDTSGDLYVIELNSIVKSSNRRNKRLFDLSVSIIFLLLYPILFLFVRNFFSFFRNIISVLFGKKSWVGLSFPYEKNTSADHSKVKTGVLTPADGLDVKVSDPEIINRLSLIYAKDYKLVNDLNIILKGFRNLGAE